MSKLNDLIYKIIIKLNTIPTSLSQLTSDSTHRTVTDTEKNTWNSKSAFSGKYKDLNGIPHISKQGYTNGETWYFPLGKFTIDNSGNYGNFTLTGRLGGWTNSNAATYLIMLMNRSNYTAETITSTVSASGQVTSALATCDLVIAKNSDLSNTLYIKCKGYFCYDFAYTEYQHSIIYDGSYSTTEPSDIVWQLSTAPKTILTADGKFSASGGISGLATVATSGSYNDLSNKPTIPTSLPANGGNADTVGGYGLRVVTDVNDTGKAGYITIIK